MSFLSVWPAGAPYPNVSTLNDPVSGGLIANAAIVVAGTGGAIQMLASNVTDVIIDINGYYAAPTDASNNTGIGLGALSSNAGGSENTAVGFDALQNNGSGQANVAMGYQALQSDVLGTLNTAVGYQALQQNTSSENTAIGSYALNLNTSGNSNTAVGNGAMLNGATGSFNTAVGQNALQNNAGIRNTAIGQLALGATTTGTDNIGIGQGSGGGLSPSGSNNIIIGNGGQGTDTNVIRLGNSTHAKIFLAAVSGVATGLSGAVPVVVDGNGQLGTMSSSARFKEDILDMGEASSGLLQLRPVTFRYKQPYADGSKPIDYGLIAEEVAKVYPDLVVRDADGQIQTVQYQKLTPMLLNEAQKQNAQIQSQNAQLQDQELQIQSQAEAIRLQQEANRKLEDRLAALEALAPSQTPTVARPASSR
jgi:hypothetical protein